LVLNMVRNGLEAMAPGVIMKIKTSQKAMSWFYPCRIRGRGIEKEVLEKIGTPFLSTKENGTGLGLAICCSIAARYVMPK